MRQDQVGQDNASLPKELESALKQHLQITSLSGNELLTYLNDSVGYLFGVCARERVYVRNINESSDTLELFYDVTDELVV